MRKLILTIAFTVLAAAPAFAQQKINLDFPDLEERAEEVVDVTLDASMLRAAAKFLSNADPEEKAIRDLAANLQGIYVRSYDFGKEGQYDRKLVERIKSQLGPTWKPLVTVRSKKKENVNIMADMRGEQIMGLVIIAAEPTEFTVVNIQGRIDMDRLAELEGHFGVPNITTEKNHD
ncbi:MAG: DUF4252 domain-containing protein [Thermoanaerobaculia bacterium]